MATTSFTFIDEINPKYAKKLAYINFEQFLSFYDECEISENNEEQDKHIQYKLLISYCKTMLKNNCKMPINYKYAKNKESGRIFVDGALGIQRIWNKFRGILCEGINIDFDMVNAHPTLLLYICKQNQITCYCLETYVKNRNMILDHIFDDDNINKTNSKILIIKAINDNQYITKYGKIKIKNPFFKSLDKELKNIQKELTIKYPDDYNIIAKKEKTNPEGKFLNSLLCILENEILQEIIKTTKDLNMIVNVPMFDGLMINKNSIGETPIRTLLDTFNNITEEYGIKWDTKEHNLELEEQLECINIDDNLFSFVGNNEIDIVNFILEYILKNRIYNCNGEVWFYNNLVWNNNYIQAEIHSIISKHYLYILFSGKYIACNKSFNSLDNLAKEIIRHAPKKDDFMEECYNSTLYKLCYKDGFYDFKKGEFIKYTIENLPFTTFIINKEFNINEDLEEEIYKRVLYPIFGVEKDELGNFKNLGRKQYMDYSLYSFARKLAGHIEDKKWMLMLGERNSGKGVIEKCFINSFGDKYIGTVNAGNFIMKSFISGEITKQDAWMASFEFSRIMFSNEIPIKKNLKTGEDEFKLNGILIKSLISGGDRITCRLNNKNERSFCIQSSLVLSANDMPPMEPYDAYNNVETFNMPNVFFDENDRKIHGEKKCATLSIIPKDDSIKAWSKTDEFIASFTNIILKAYKTKIQIPDFIIKEAVEDKSDNDDYNKLINLFDFLGKSINETTNIKEFCCELCCEKICKSHIVPFHKIDKLLKDNKIPISKIKANKYLIAKDCEKEIINNVRYLRGLSIRELEF